MTPIILIVILLIILAEMIAAVEGLIFFYVRFIVSLVMLAGIIVCLLSISEVVVWP